MQTINDLKDFSTSFFSPAHTALLSSEHQRNCPGLSDVQWMQMGVTRVLKECRSGRGFLQDWAMSNPEELSVDVSLFFNTLKSSRRLALIEDINTLVARSMPSHPDGLIDELDELAKFDIYAGDGHYHSTSTHEDQIQGKRRAVGHFYTLNLRTHGLTHMAAADHEGGLKKAEHDMHVLKRMSTKSLRQGAAKGRKVLYVWDCAGIDIRQWFNWKQAAGVYFLSCNKDNMKITVYGPQDFDPKDPINAGVQSDSLVTNASAGVTFRLIKYKCPHSGTEYEFISNQMTIRPGVLAWLYMRRWDIEKTYDTFKNKMNEQKAWGKTTNAKTMQAQFLCMAHNLMVLLQNSIGEENQIEDHKEIKRAQTRCKAILERCRELGAKISPLYLNPYKRSQFSLKFIRWVGYHLSQNSLYGCAISSLKRIYTLL
jgi:hypothetical protein